MDYMHKDVVGVGVNAWMLPLVGEASSLVGGHPRACIGVGVMKSWLALGMGAWKALVLPLTMSRGHHHVQAAHLACCPLAPLECTYLGVRTT